MNQLINKTRVILIGGSSHAGKSTLGRSLAEKLCWNYSSTDKLARHPGRPWITNGKAIPEHVAEHYRTLSIDALFLDVLSHYKQNVFSQIETIVDAHKSDLARECLILEGSALVPKFVSNLVKKNGVQAIWLTGSDQLLQNRILSESNFNNVGKDEHYLIQKFIARTLLYNQYIKQEVERLRLKSIKIEAVSTADELLQKCRELLKI
jgi:2-phosphoglycerate kinase